MFEVFFFLFFSLALIFPLTSFPVSISDLLPEQPKIICTGGNWQKEELGIVSWPWLCCRSLQKPLPKWGMCHQGTQSHFQLEQSWFSGVRGTNEGISLGILYQHSILRDKCVLGSGGCNSACNSFSGTWQPECLDSIIIQAAKQSEVLCLSSPHFCNVGRADAVDLL